MPKLDNVLHGILRKNKEIWIEFQEIEYESILIGGMSVRVIR